MSEKYRSKIDENPFPNDHIDPKVKENLDFGMKVAKAIEARYLYDLNGDTSNIDRYILNRQYAEGTNDPNVYKPKLNGDSDESYLNMDFSIIPIVPKFVDIIVGEMINADWSIECNSIDPISLGEKKRRKDELFINMTLKDYNEQQKEITGMSIIPEGDYIPEDDDDIEIYVDLNEKQAGEIAMEQLISEVMKSNYFKKKIYPRLCRDLVENKKAVLRVKYDTANRIVLRYVDIVNYVSSFSDQPDLSDVDFEAEKQKLSIRQIRQMAGSHITEFDLFEIAKATAKNNGDKWLYGDTYREDRYDSNIYNYDNYLVDCLDFVYYSIDVNKWEKKPNKYDGFFFNKKKFKHKGKVKGNLYEKSVETSYEGLYILGMSKLVKYGRSKNIIRPNEFHGMSPYVTKQFIAIMPNSRNMVSKSLVDRMRPHADQIQILNLKIQQFLAQAAPSGIAVDLSAISDLDIGSKGQTLEPHEAIKLYEQKGIVLYNGVDSETGQMRQGVPITPLDNGVSRSIVQFIELYRYQLDQIRAVTGINEVRDGSSPNSKDLKGVRQQALLSSNNSTRELFQWSIFQVEKTAEVIVSMLQQRSRFDLEGFRKDYENVIGAAGVKSMEDIKDVHVRKYGIHIEIDVTDEDRVKFDAYLDREISNNTLRLEDAFTARRIKNQKKAERFLAVKRRKFDKAKQEEQMMLQQSRAQADQQSAMVAAQAEAQKIQMTTQSKAQLLKVEEEKEINIEMVKHQNKMAQLKLEGQIKSIHIEQATEEDMLAEEFKGKMGEGNNMKEGVGSMLKVSPKPADDAIVSSKPNITP